MANIIDPNTAPVAGIYTEQIMSMHDVFKPQNIPTLFARYGAQYMPMFQIFRSLGREEPIARDEWHGWEENWMHQAITTSGTTVAGAAGASVDITLATSMHDSKGNSYPRVGMIISFPGTYVQGHITAKDESVSTAHVLTVTPAKSTDVIPATTDGETLAITNNAFGAGTDQPKGTVLASTKRSFVAQIFKETIGAEGSQLVNEKWYKVLDDGRNLKGYYSPGYMRGEYLMSLAMDGAFTWGDETDNVTVPSGEPGAGNLVKTTKGIMRHATELGKTITYTEGSFSPTSLDQGGLYLKSQGITTGFVFGWVGANFSNDIENGMVSYLGNNSAPDYTTVVDRLFGKNKDLAVSIGFSVIKKGGITYILKPMDSWSNPKTFGATGYDLGKYGLFTPLGRLVDPVRNIPMDNIATRYRAYDGYSRRFETWSVSGAGNGRKVISIDKTNTFFRAHLGLQVFKANQFMIFKPA